jgi:hypothetical protein
MKLRTLHHYLGVFFAPAILFFAFSGALQTFSLHENHGGGPYKPPAWIVVLASIHKDQTLPHPKGHHGKPAAAAPAPAGEDADKDHADADHDDHDHADAPKPAVAPSAAGPKADPDGPPQAKGPSPLPLKIFVLFVSGGLIVSTGLGLWMALKARMRRPATLALLALGTLIPIALLFV